MQSLPDMGCLWSVEKRSAPDQQKETLLCLKLNSLEQEI